VPLNNLARYRRNLKPNWARSRPGLGGVVRGGEGPECFVVRVANRSRGSKVWLRLYPGGAQTLSVVGVVRLGGPGKTGLLGLCHPIGGGAQRGATLVTRGPHVYH